MAFFLSFFFFSQSFDELFFLSSMVGMAMTAPFLLDFYCKSAMDVEMGLLLHSAGVFLAAGMGGLGIIIKRINSTKSFETIWFCCGGL